VSGREQSGGVAALKAISMFAWRPPFACWGRRTAVEDAMAFDSQEFVSLDLFGSDQEEGSPALLKRGGSSLPMWELEEGVSLAASDGM